MRSLLTPTSRTSRTSITTITTTKTIILGSLLGFSAGTLILLKFVNWSLLWKRINQRVVPAKKRLKKLDGMEEQEVPKELKTSFYFDTSHEFEHWEIFHSATNVIQVLDNIHSYAKKWLNKTCNDGSWKSKRLGDCGWEIVGTCPAFVLLDVTVDLNEVYIDKMISLDNNLQSNENLAKENNNINKNLEKENNCLMLCKNVQIHGGIIDLSRGSVYIGEGTTIYPNTFIEGPAIIGKNCCIRPGAYLRGDTIIGNGVFIRGELKNIILMDKAELCHPSYCGDSICGYQSHFGNQATTANLGMLNSQDIAISIDSTIYQTSRRKIGVILGDYSQLGCNTVTDPGTLIGSNTIVYPLTRLSKGIYGPFEIIKNKPMEAGVIQRSPLFTISN